MRDYDGKTAAERIAERRERLIDAGVELFGERGYAATSIRSVLQQSGLRDRYFGESFADLDSLLAAVYSRLIDEEISGCAAAIDKTNGGSEGARAMIDTITRSFEKNPGKARIKSREVLSGGPVAREQRHAGLRRLAQLVADLLPPSTALNSKRCTPARSRYRGRRRRTSDDVDGQRRRTDPRPCGRRGHAVVRCDRSPHQLYLRAALLQVQGSREASSRWPPPMGGPDNVVTTCCDEQTSGEQG